MHAIMKFHMRRLVRYECDVPYPLSLDSKYRMVKLNKAEYRL